MKAFEYKLMVGFEDTNLVGNVYFANHVRWQGKCREMFLRRHAPEVVDEIARDLSLVTLRCSCEYFAELRAFDEVLIRMTLDDLRQNRVTMHFDYYRVDADSEELIARGEQAIACMRRAGEEMIPTPVPAGMRDALRAYERNGVHA